MNLTKFKHFYFNKLSLIFIAVGALFIILAYGPILKDELWYRFKELKSQKYVLKTNSAVSGSESVFAKYLTATPIIITPINTDFAVVIEKIGINAPIVADVSVSDKASYEAALKRGVAHASVSNYPSERPGNVYLFAHALVNFWQLGKYATTFNLLGKLVVDDKINIFYKGKRYVYRVVNKEIYPGWNTFPLNRPLIEPILTLQTCDPPGTTRNRLVVTAKLVSIE